MTAKVTIVIPTYNGEKYIKKTIQSCIDQTYPNISVIIIDDNSTDNTLNELKYFNSEIKIIRNIANQGLPKNINKVILNDDSTFFIYLGHDDILPNRHVEIMVNTFNTETVAVHCNSMAIDPYDNKLSFTRDDEIQIKKTNNIMYQLSIDNFISVIGMMHRTDIFKSICGWDESYDLYGEWLYYIKLAQYGKIKYTKETYAFYRIHDNNITKSLHINKDKLQKYYQYKKKCRQLAHRHTAFSFYNEFNYRKYYLLNYLRYIKALYKSFN